MKRLVKDKLIVWKNSMNRKPLIIYGARQIGKTYTILDFGKTEYDNVLYCNFENDKELHKLFDRNLNPERIIEALKAYFSISIVKGRTLIFFDEIQACEAALTSLKYFNEEANDYHIVAAGSLLGLAINRGSFSFPVGKVDMINMFPMDFEEFMVANNVSDTTLNMLKEKFETCRPVDEFIHQKLLYMFLYILL